jgi:hypothetical protein
MQRIKMALQQGALLAWVFAAGTVLLLWQSLGLSPVASLIPRFVLLFTLLLLLVEIALEMTASARPGAGSENSSSETEPLPRRPERLAMAPQQPWRVISWIALLPLATGLFGVIAGGALFCMAFLRWRSRESWLYSLTVALLLGLILQALFSWVFQAGLYQGLWTR